MTKDEVFNKYFTDISPKICFNKIGAGETVIFLHGIGGNKSNWHKQMLHLSNICFFKYLLKSISLSSIDPPFPK